MRLANLFCVCRRAAGLLKNKDKITRCRRLRFPPSENRGERGSLSRSVSQFENLMIVAVELDHVVKLAQKIESVAGKEIGAANFALLQALARKQ